MKSKVTFKRSPFFYVGDKYKLIGDIKKHFPEKINTFVEPFLGGGSVFLNTEAKKYILNDIDKNVVSLHRFLLNQSKQENEFLNNVKKITEKYNLSRSVFANVVPDYLRKKWIKTYYAEYNREGYNLLRSNYNKASKKDPLVLYLLLVYGFNRILRFNKSGGFNVPVGNVDFNKNVLNSLQDYFLIAKGKDLELHSKDFKIFISGLKLKKDDFVYVDPPYLISASEYNKLWNEDQEAELLKVLTDLDKKGVNFALSNMIFYNGKKNEKLIAWMKNYNVHTIDSNYISYHDNTKKKISEVLITNY